MIGSSVARHVARAGGFSELTLADRDETKAVALASELGARALYCDAQDPDSVKSAMTGADLVFNSVGPFHEHGLTAVRAAIEAGCHYVDVNDDCDLTARVMSDITLDQTARAAGLIVLSGIGSSPGLSNLMAASAANELDHVHALHLVKGVSFVPNLSPATLRHMFHSLSGEVTQFLDGRHRSMPAWGDPQEYPLLPPFDQHHEFGYIGHSEAITLPRSVPGVRDVTTRFSWFEEPANKLYQGLAELGFLDATQSGSSRSALEVTAELLSVAGVEASVRAASTGSARGTVWHVRAEGDQRGRPASIVLEAQFLFSERRDGASGGAELTAVPAAMAISQIMAGELTARGVVAPEECLDAEPFVREAFTKLGVPLDRRVFVSE